MAQTAAVKGLCHDKHQAAAAPLCTKPHHERVQLVVICVAARLGDLGLYAGASAWIEGAR
jgi:hypothetical protein